MSTILDALRRRPTESDADPSATARTDRVLATLGYRRHEGSGGLTRGRLLAYAGAAVALGFVGFWIVLMILAPARPAVQRAAATPAPSPAVTSPPRPETRPVPPPASPALSPSAPVTPAPPVTRPQAPAVPPAPVTPPAPPRVTTPAAPATPPVPRVATSSPRPEPVEGRQTETPAAPAPVSAPVAPPTDHFGLAVYYHRIGDFDNALAQYRILLNENESSAEVHNNVGLVYRERGQLDEAVKEFQRAIEIDPKYVRAHNNLGVVLMSMGSNRLDAAAAEFRVALTADPRNLESMVNLALVQRAAGRGADARDMLLRAVGLDARSPGAHYNLAVVADEAGETSMAVEHYRAFLKFGAVTHADLLARVRARLAVLGPG